jgi:hypothetical protein
LGRTIALSEATEEGYLVEPEESEDEEEDEGSVAIAPTYIPTYPFPYKRGVSGGVYREPMKDEEEAKLFMNMTFT